MKVLMTGGTGFLGTALRRRLELDGHSISCLTRTQREPQGATAFFVNEAVPDLPPHDAVINLAGESVVGLWTPAKRRSIYDSRIDGTRALADWIERSTEKPSVFLSGSAVGIYGDGGQSELTEKTDVSGSKGFLAQVCRDWEHAASGTAWRGTRTVFLRTGQVFDPSGGYLGKVLPIMRRFPIVILGERGAYVPWISLEDWIGLVLFAMDNESVTGPLNLAAPSPATQQELTEGIALRLGKKIRGRVPRFVLKLAGGFGESMTFSQRVLPQKAENSGYSFEHSSLIDYLDRVTQAKS